MEEKVVKPKVGVQTVPNPEKVLASSQTTGEKELTSESAYEEAVKAAGDTESREIPLGEPTEDPMFQAVAKYFDVKEGSFHDAVHDLEFIIDHVTREIGTRDLADLDKVFNYLRDMEDRLARPADFDVKRYQRLYNYLILKEKADAMNRALSALERRRYE